MKKYRIRIRIPDGTLVHKKKFGTVEEANAWVENSGIKEEWPDMDFDITESKEHHDISCCAVCDNEVLYTEDRSPKMHICQSCSDELEKRTGIRIVNSEELLEWLTRGAINEAPKKCKLLLDIGYSPCIHINDVDSAFFKIMPDAYGLVLGRAEKLPLYFERLIDTYISYEEDIGSMRICTETIIEEMESEGISELNANKNVFDMLKEANTWVLEQKNIPPDIVYTLLHVLSDEIRSVYFCIYLNDLIHQRR
jgi:hypothetical protein